MIRSLTARSIALWCAVLLGILGMCASLLLAAEVKKLTINGTQLGWKQEGKVRVTTLQNAEVLQEDSRFVADTIVVRSEGNVHEFTCTGNPVFTDPENKITGDKVIGQSTPRMAEFIGNVVMVSTPKKKDDGTGEVRSQISSEPSTTTSDRLLYKYSEKTGVATGNVVIKQKDRTVWADQAVYDQKSELVTLTGNVRMKNVGKGELKDLKDAETVTVSLENDWVDIVAKKGGRITMELEVQDEEETPAASPTDNKTNGEKATK